MTTEDHSNKEACGTVEQSEDDGLAEFYENLSKNFNVLPLFERQYNDFVRIRQYSLRNNEKLRSRWHDRVVNGKTTKTAAPNVNDYHFHNCRTKFLPSESRANYPPPRNHLAPGPGVDKFGQRPIPDDMMLRKPVPNHSQSAGKNKTKNANRERHQINKKTT